MTEADKLMLCEALAVMWWNLEGYTQVEGDYENKLATMMECFKLEPPEEDHA